MHYKLCNLQKNREFQAQCLSTLKLTENNMAEILTGNAVIGTYCNDGAELTFITKGVGDCVVLALKSSYSTLIDIDIDRYDDIETETGTLGGCCYYYFGHLSSHQYIYRDYNSGDALGKLDAFASVLSKYRLTAQLLWATGLQQNWEATANGSISIPPNVFSHLHSLISSKSIPCTIPPLFVMSSDGKMESHDVTFKISDNTFRLYKGIGDAPVPIDATFPLFRIITYNTVRAEIDQRKRNKSNCIIS